MEDELDQYLEVFVTGVDGLTLTVNRKRPGP